MKHYFTIIDSNLGENKIYSIEADNIDAAKNEFVKRFAPFIEDIDYSDLVEGLDKGFEIQIEYCGEEIIKI